MWCLCVRSVVRLWRGFLLVSGVFGLLGLLVLLAGQVLARVTPLLSPSPITLAAPEDVPFEGDLEPSPAAPSNGIRKIFSQAERLRITHATLNVPQ